jgi:hypothetical protein
MLRLVAEYQRRTTAERTADAKRRAVARGVPPFPNVPPGYRKRDDGRLEVVATEAETVEAAFRMRGAGATIATVRAFLREHDVERSFHGTQALLRSRMYLGELRFGDLVNEHAHAAIIDEATWRKVQRMEVPRGRRPKSERLLARLGVLRCGTCGARMVVGFRRDKRSGRRYDFYRCPPIGDCPRRVTISANVVEQAVAEAVKELLANVAGTASADATLSAARADRERFEAELDAAVRAFDGLDDVEAVRERLTTLRDARDEARERVVEFEATVLPAVTVMADDWDDLTLDEQRGLIRATIARVVVAPGSAHGRVTIESRAQ